MIRSDAIKIYWLGKNCKQGGIFLIYYMFNHLYLPRISREYFQKTIRSIVPLYGHNTLGDCS